MKPAREEISVKLMKPITALILKQPTGPIGAPQAQPPPPPPPTQQQPLDCTQLSITSLEQ